MSLGRLDKKARIQGVVAAAVVVLEVFVAVWRRAGSLALGMEAVAIGRLAAGGLSLAALTSVVVEKEAQKTNAYQQNNNVLVSDKSTINAKPQLEIFADDVKCSHGCTIGQLDESAMFYLRSRGIPEKEAKALLMYAFANNVLESVKIPELKRRINKLIANKLGVNIGFDL